MVSLAYADDSALNKRLFKTPALGASAVQSVEQPAAIAPTNAGGDVSLNPQPLPPKAILPNTVLPTGPATKPIGTGIIDGKSVYKPQGQIPTGVNNACFGDCNFAINGGGFPTYGTGKSIAIKSPSIVLGGVPPKLRLFLTADNKRIDLSVQVIQNGVLSAQFPSNEYYITQPVEAELIIGYETLRNTQGKYQAEMVEVSNSTVLEGVKSQECIRSCLTWPVTGWQTGLYLPIQSSGLVTVSQQVSSNDDVGQYWANKPIIYQFNLKALKPQFEVVEATLGNVAIQTCNADSDGVWTYRGDAAFNKGLLDSNGKLMTQATVSPDVVHCRYSKGFKGTLIADARHTLTANMRFNLKLRGPKGVSPWQ